MVLLVPTEGETCIIFLLGFIIYRVLLLYLPTYHHNAYSNLIFFHILILSNLVNNRHKLLLLERAVHKSLDYIQHKDRSLGRDKTKAFDIEGCNVRNRLNEINTKCFQTAYCSYTRSKKTGLFYDSFVSTAVSYMLQPVSYYSCQFKVAVRCVFPVGSAQQSRYAFLIHLGLHAATFPQEPQASLILQSR